MGELVKSNADGILLPARVRMLFESAKHTVENPHGASRAIGVTLW